MSTADWARALTRWPPLMARDAVARETPATLATSSRVGEPDGGGVRGLLTRATLVVRRAVHGEGAGAREVGVPARARLRRARLGGVVDVHEPEALGVAEGPLEVVEERPLVEAAYVDALLDGAVHRPEAGVEQRGAGGVVDDAVLVAPVAAGRSRLGEVDRQVRRAVLQRAQQPVQPVGLDLPAHVGDRQPAAREGDVLGADEGRERDPV